MKRREEPRRQPAPLPQRTVTDISDRSIGENFLDTVLGFAGSFFWLFVRWQAPTWLAFTIAAAWVAFAVWMILRSARFGFMAGILSFVGLVGLIWGLCFRG